MNVSFNRRTALKLAGIAPCAMRVTIGEMMGTTARAATEPNLPFRTSGFEHYSVTVPDPEATARFYAKIFDPQVFQEKDPPARFYVKIGGIYVAVGGPPRNGAAPFIDHFSATIQDYNLDEMRKSLDAAGVKLPAGRFAMIPDPDGIRLQMNASPAGLAKTVVPAFRLASVDAALQAIGIDHVMLQVTDVAKSAEHYRKLLGPEVAGGKKSGEVWFHAGRTRLGLQTATGKPGVDHICIRVAEFDRKKTAERLKRVEVESMSSPEQGLLRFRDPNGIVTELKGEA